MKDNFLMIKDKDGKKKEYRVLLDIEDTSNDVNYIIYTDDKKDKNGSIKCYASSYVLSDKGNMTKFKAIESETEFDFIKDVLNSLNNN